MVEIPEGSPGLTLSFAVETLRQVNLSPVTLRHPTMRLSPVVGCLLSLNLLLFSSCCNGK